jgi:SAM-dependent methyltransferase
MTEQEKNAERLFGEEFWQGEGGDKWVQNIDLLEHHLEELNSILLDRCAAAPGEAVLDVGCGGARTSMALAQRVGPTGRVLAVDVSAVILEVAKRRGGAMGNLEFRLADAGVEDLGAESFDLITSRFGVMFFNRQVAAFANLRRCLKPDGRLVFMCWRRFEENPWMAVPAAAAFSVLPPPEQPGQEPDIDAPGPFSLGEEERLQFVLQEAGFTEISLEPVDTGIQMGGLDEACHLVTQTGPAARLLAEAAEADRKAALAAIRTALREFETAVGVEVPGACWVASAGC